ncbi:MAG: VanZ family protein [Chlamydiota bacterium]|nr:VanZ family protein [Chlamydiota bacterium]
MKKKNIFVYWMPFIVYAFLIFYVSSQSLENVDLGGIYGLDKCIHALEYAILVFLGYRAFVFGTNGFFDWSWALLLSLLVSVLYAISDEYHQSFVPNRHTDILDLMADVTGIVVFVFFIIWMRRRFVRQDSGMLSRRIFFP